MNLRQILYFSRIAAEQNMTRAAEQLNVAQTALGLQIRNLEAELGTSLIERHSRGVRLTKAGEVFASHAASILQAIENAANEVRETGGAEALPVVIGLTPSVMTLLGTELVGLAGRAGLASPVNYVEALSFNLVSALLREELQFALAFNVEARAGLVRRALLEEPLFLVSSTHSGHTQEPVGLSEAVATDLALMGDRDIIWSIVHDTASYLSLDVNVAFRLQSISAIKILVERGVATSIMPYGLVASEVERGVLNARRIDDPRMIRTLFLIRPDRMLRLHEQQIEDFVVDRIVGTYAALSGAMKR